MTDVPIWSWPRIHRGTTESRFYLQPSNLGSTSPYTGQRSPYGPQVQAWRCEVTLPTKRGPDWRELSAFISRLDGISGLVRMTDYNRMRPGYDVAVTPTIQAWSDDSYWSDGTGWASGYLPPYVAVDEAAELGADSIVLRSLPVSLTRCLRMGDLIEARPSGIPARHGFLHEVVNDLNTNADGKTRVQIRPRLRAGLAAGDQIVLRVPTSVFRLASDNEGIVNRRIGNLGEIGISLIEELPR